MQNNCLVFQARQHQFWVPSSQNLPHDLVECWKKKQVMSLKLWYDLQLFGLIDNKWSENCIYYYSCIYSYLPFNKTNKL